jgi:hypothetical protein
MALYTGTRMIAFWRGRKSVFGGSRRGYARDSIAAISSSEISKFA